MGEREYREVRKEAIVVVRVGDDSRVSVVVGKREEIDLSFFLFIFFGFG